MEIKHIGHSCFQINTSKLNIVIDPYDSKIGLKVPSLSADVVLVTHDHFDHSNIDAVSGYKNVLSGPGEYEIAGVSILGFPTFHDNSEGSERGKNTIYLLDIEGINILHLGDLGHELKKETLEKLPDIHILMVPVGGHFTISADVATKVISSIEPGFVIPMHYQTKSLDVGTELADLSKFLNAMGVSNPETVPSLKVSRLSDIPEETSVLVVKPASE